MVNFNSDSTVSTPAADIIRILILQRRNDLIEAMESYYKIAEQGSDVDIFVIKARLKSFYWEIEAALSRNLSDEEFDKMKEKVFSAKDIKTIEEVYEFINEFLDKMRLIRIDTRQQYDSIRVTQEDEAHGL